jgi:carboxylesterase
MLRAIASILAAVTVVHAVVYRWRMVEARRRDAARLAIGSDGIIAGAEPITLHASQTHAVLLLHGFGDTPQTVQLLAAHLHDAHGWTVHAPLLPGHGRTLADFDHSGSRAWRDAVHRDYIALKSQYATVALVGLSMGGALATLEAALDPALPALVLLAPYLTPPASAQRLAPLAGVINLLMPYLAGGDRERSIFDPEARAFALGYGGAPPKRVRDLVSVAHDARFAAADVLAPTLLVNSRTDYRIPLPLAEQHPELFTSATVREQQWVTGCGHVITVDYCREHVWALTSAWLERFAGKPTAASVV